MSTKRLCLFLVLSLFLPAACKTARAPAEKDAAPKIVHVTEHEYKPAKSADKTGQVLTLTFMDSTVFDNDLSEALKEGYREVIVIPSSPFTLNDIPERLDRWLSAVKETGGIVKARAVVPQTRFRGIFGMLIDVFVALFDAAREAALYAPAKNRDVLIEYGTETGKVIRFRLLRRGLIAKAMEQGNAETVPAPAAPASLRSTHPLTGP